MCYSELPGDGRGWIGSWLESNHLFSKWYHHLPNIYHSISQIQAGHWGLFCLKYYWQSILQIEKSEKDFSFNSIGFTPCYLWTSSTLPLYHISVRADKAVLKSIWIPFLRSGDGIIELLYIGTPFSLNKTFHRYRSIYSCASGKRMNKRNCKMDRVLDKAIKIQDKTLLSEKFWRKIPELKCMDCINSFIGN